VIQIQVAVTGNEVMKQLQRLRNGLADRRQLHARVAVNLEAYVVDHVRGLNQHRTANRLGASPTNHLEKSSKLINSDSDQQGAVLRFPRASRLRAAFGTYKVRPRSGKKYLTIPAHRLTYGKRVSDIQEPLFFKMVGGRHKALCFQKGAGLAGTVAFWLREEVTIKEDRTLIPFSRLPELTRRVAVAYVEELIEQKGGLA